VVIEIRPLRNRTVRFDVLELRDIASLAVTAGLHFLEFLSNLPMVKNIGTSPHNAITNNDLITVLLAPGTVA
jgi:hypothetical protein